MGLRLGALDLTGRLRSARGAVAPTVMLWLAWPLGTGCSHAPVADDLRGAQYPLVTQDSVAVDFPACFRGHVVLATFIYTHCSDVCLNITRNMEEVAGAAGVDPALRPVAITFDPRRDTPSVLRAYRQARGGNMMQWCFLTGAEGVVDSLMDRMGIVRRKTYTAIAANGEEMYFVNHNDRIVLIDRHGMIRRRYRGLKVDVRAVVRDIHALERED